MSNAINKDSDLAGWLNGKISEAEKTLRVREEMARTCRLGTDAEWNSAAAMHPSTAGMKSKRADRLKEAAGHDRIAARLRYDLQMLCAIRSALTQPNAPVSK